MKIIQKKFLLTLICLFLFSLDVSAMGWGYMLDQSDKRIGYKNGLKGSLKLHLPKTAWSCNISKTYPKAGKDVGKNQRIPYSETRYIDCNYGSSGAKVSLPVKRYNRKGITETFFISDKKDEFTITLICAV